MGYIVRMPKLGLEMEEGTLLEWTTAKSEAVAEGDQVAEIESEKSVGEVDAREGGVLRQTYLDVDEVVPPGTPIGVIAAPDADISELEAEAEADLAAEAPEVADAQAGTAGSDGTETAADAGASDASPEPSASGSADLKASPRAEKRAEELGVDLTAVEGTGPQGAITADDVETATDAEASDASPEPGASGSADPRVSPRAERRAEELGVDLTAVEGTGPQGAVTVDDVEASEEAPTAQTAGGVRRITPDDATRYRYERASAVADGPAAAALFETTEAVRSAFEERVTMTDVLAVVVSAALAEHPPVNATYAEGTHQLQESRNLALTVGVEGDPTAGVIEGAGELSVTEVVEARQGLGGDASGEVPTFTLANAGESDSEGLLVNEPAVAALEVDPTGRRATPTGDGVDLQPLVTATLTYDTRALDGADARAFLGSVLDCAERAAELVLGSYRGGE
jgi:Pyruvate/2-oxoglutarate dehydrogenase complex, dihydrolipoamide acyltransferase (E2) component, and related enzymes